VLILDERGQRGRIRSTMGANKTYQKKGEMGRMHAESGKFRRLRHAIEKGCGDRESAIAFVCRLPCPLARRVTRRDPSSNACAF